MSDETTTLKAKDPVSGKVTRTELYGAFVDIGTGQDAILHVSQLGKRVNRVDSVVKKGDEIQAWIHSVDTTNDRITLTLREPLATEWKDIKAGAVFTGKVTKIEKFGAFIDIGAEKDGLVHVSELSHEFLKHPTDAISEGEEVEVQVLTSDRKKKRINLSRKALLDLPEGMEREEEPSFADIEDEDVELINPMELALRAAMGDEPPSHKQRKRKKHKRKGRRRNDDIYARTLEYNRE